ncbi:MAG: type II secretion system protein [Pseudomonadota bacterium]
MRAVRGFSLLEFAVVVLIIAGVVYALIPRVGDSLKLAHETVVTQTSAAYRESLKLVALKHKALNAGSAIYDLAGAGNGQLDLNQSGFPVGVDRTPGEERPLQAQDCEALWYALLGGIPPSASVQGDSDFRVQTRFDASHGLGCHYRYRRGGEMAIQYFPTDGTVTADVRF